MDLLSNTELMSSIWSGANVSWPSRWGEPGLRLQQASLALQAVPETIRVRAPVTDAS